MVTEHLVAMKKRIEGIYRYICRYKYVLTLAIFIVIIGFADSNSYIKRRALQQSNDSIRAQLAYYEACCKRDSARLKQLQSNPDKLVRVAREDYLMKSDDEDVYIVIEE